MAPTAHHQSPMAQQSGSVFILGSVKFILPSNSFFRRVLFSNLKQWGSGWQSSSVQITETKGPKAQIYSTGFGVCNGITQTEKPNLPILTSGQETSLFSAMVGGVSMLDCGSWNQK